MRDWLGVLLKATGPEELATIARAVDAAYANDSGLRRLSHFRELLAGARRPEPGDLASRLDPWIIDGPHGPGEHGWLFDNAVDELDLSSRTLGFDMPGVITVLSGRESTVRKLDILREKFGDSPGSWYPALTGEYWPGEAEDMDHVWAEAAE